jgi:hypothetical protein
MFLIYNLVVEAAVTLTQLETLINLDLSRTVFQYGPSATLPSRSGRSEDSMPGPVGLPVIEKSDRSFCTATPLAFSGSKADDR